MTRMLCLLVVAACTPAVKGGGSTDPVDGAGDEETPVADLPGEPDPREGELPTADTSMPVVARGGCPQMPVQGATPLVRTPYLTAMTSTAVTISFASPIDGAAEIRYALGTGTLESSLAERLVLGTDVTELTKAEYQFSARIEGLTPSTEYCYVPVLDGVQLASPAVFRTAPAPGDPAAFDVLVFGDSGNASAAQKRVLSQMAQRNFDLILHTGDLAYEDGKYSDFAEKVFGVYAGIFAVRPFFPSLGNHEYETPGALPYRTLFALPEQAAVFTDNERYYAYDWGGTHFVALDSNAPLNQDAMTPWLEADLAQSTAKFKIAYFHHSPYSSGPHGSDTRVQTKLIPRFQAGGVDLVLTGHDHDYERTHPMWNNTPAASGIIYAVTGGGGGGLYSPTQTGAVFTAKYAKKYHFMLLHIAGCMLSASTIDEDGAEIDSFSISKCP